MVSLTIENLSKIQRLLKNAQRASRAVIYSADGGVEPQNASNDVAVIRTAISNAADTTAAAQAIVALVSDYVL